MPPYLKTIRINNCAMPAGRRGPVPMGRMSRLIEKIKYAVSWKETGAARPASAGLQRTRTRGRLSATDGPFTETKEMIGGDARF